MNSRTAGAPRLPVATEEEITLAQLDAARAAGDITPEQHQAMVASMQDRVAGEGMRMGEFPSEAGPAAQAAAMLPRTGEYPRPAGPGAVMADPGERQYGRLSRPNTEIMTASEIRERRLAADIAKRVAEAQDRMDARRYGSRHGGGAPFRSEGEVAEYNRRNLLSEEEKLALRAQGRSERDIALMQMSDLDKDAIKSGYSGGSGWVPVYTPSGGVTYLERAYSDGFGPSATQQAFGTARVGERVASGEISDSLERPDLEAKGYTKENMQGPYGQETVWKRTALGEELEAKLRRERGADAPLPTLEEYVAEQQNNRMMRRLRNDALGAGLAREQMEGKTASDLRTLIADTRAAAKGRQAEVNRRARMATPYRRELAFSEMGQGNDWQDAVAARQFGMGQTTPLDVDRANAEEALGIARSMVQGMEQGEDIRSLMFRQQQAQEAAKLAEEVGKELGVTASGFGWLGSDARATPQQLEEIRDRVAARFGPELGAQSVQGWRVKPLAPPPPAAGPALPPAAAAPPARLPLDPRLVNPGVF